jgi:peptide/nickel transport system permease protein
MATDIGPVQPRERLWRRGIFKRRAAWIAFAFMCFLILVAVLGPVLAPHDPNVQDLVNRNAHSSGSHLLGQDLYGRDVLSRLILGTRVTLLAALVAVTVAVAIGVPTGLLAGFRGGIVDAIFSRLTDALLSMPALILVLAIITVLGPGVTRAMVAAGVVSSPRLFRVARGAAIRVAQLPFVEAARADGASSGRILFRHILPNSSGPLLVQVSFILGFAIMAEASLSFLGLGVAVPTASWGSMLRESFTQINRSSFQLFPPIIIITLTVYALTIIGDATRDSLSRRELVDP